MSGLKVLLRFDTEDYITVESNQAVSDILDILDQLSIRATFVLVGEKIKLINNNPDIIDKLQKHALGYHSYRHSYHPLANEYLINKGWNQGIDEFMEKEEDGYHLFVNTFQKNPICFTQPGADWIPHAYPALQQWQIPFFFSENKHSLINIEEEPFFINEILSFAKEVTISDLTSLSNKGLWEDAKTKFDKGYQQAISKGDKFIVIACHPGRMITTGQPWDIYNFGGGQNKAHQEWLKAPLKDKIDYQQDLMAFKEFLIHLKENYNIDWITAEEFLRLHEKANSNQQIDKGTIQELAQKFTAEISFYQANDYWLSPIQAGIVLARFILTNVDEGYYPAAVKAPGPVYFPDKINDQKIDPALDRIGWTELVTGAKYLIDRFNKYNSFPLKIKVSPNLWINTEQLIGGLAQAIVSMTVDNIPQDRILLPGTYLKTRDYVKKIDQIQWDWPIFEKGFQNQEIVDYTKLLSWTLRPS